MADVDGLLLRSALTPDSSVMPNADLMPWFWSRRKAHRHTVERIPFAKMERWQVESDTGNLVHDTGKFFSIEGVHVETNYGTRSEWQQPMIIQPEIGILGIITKQIDGVLHCLMQVKLEPGNINMVQLSPTLQATHSNYTCIHEGRMPSYLEYFFDLSKHRVLVDSLQSEQGGRFFRKRNRNLVIEVTEEVPELPDFAWLTIGQIQQLLSLDNIVNMDARTVIGCIPFEGHCEAAAEIPTLYRRQLLASALAHDGALHDKDELLSWFATQKFSYHLDVRRIPLNEVGEWSMGDSELSHNRDDYFSVIACSIAAEGREVLAWTQPLIKTLEPGLVAFITRPINGLLHFLIQAKVEPGVLDVVELAPTVQCTTGNYRLGASENRAPYLDYVLSAPPDKIRHDTHLSEEGGRFYREANRNLVIAAGEEFPLDAPANYAWMTLGQLKEFVKYNNFLNVECRCLMSCLAFLESSEGVH